MNIEGVVLIVGAGSGIGRQVALKMAEHGASTVICAGGDKQAIEETSLLVEQQQRKLGITVVVSSIVVDIRSEESVKTMFERSRELEWRIDIVVYAAHRPEVAPITQAFHKGSIVIVTSPASEGSLFGLGNYIAAKNAMQGLVQTAALESGQRGVRVNAVAPAYIFGEDMNTYRNYVPASKDLKSLDLPMGRLGRPYEVANAVVFLASFSASYINGHTLVVDGGVSLQLKQ
ncbi:hypothetical protein MMC10_008106 [Thelotrema lepadinum]|nr:hypothetical protein [Thelotrema lepadinum]